MPFVALSLLAMSGAAVAFGSIALAGAALAPWSHPPMTAITRSILAALLATGTLVVLGVVMIGACIPEGRLMRYAAW
ncbi:MAG: hypothetical protein MZV65_31900 [Chromatiales bacterium]|nr:hypothetical protein [Chromatiales bacterium]